MWSSKKVFQSADKLIAKNLVSEVKDGEVLEIMQNGDIKQIDLATRNIGEFGNFEDVLNRNSDQRMFTYEVATGEGLPSGTPYRLGVLMTNAVKSFFDKKREKFGLFLKRLVLNQVMDVFKTENRKKHPMTILPGEQGYAILKKLLVDVYTAKTQRTQQLSGRIPDEAVIRAKYEKEIESKHELFFNIPESFYDDIKATFILTVTGEEINVEKRMETLTNLYTSLAAKGDPRADAVLEQIVAITGMNLESLAGVKKEIPAPQTSPVMPTMKTAPANLQL
jgi:hypothetical protein